MTYPVYLTEYQIDIIRLALLSAKRETESYIESSETDYNAEYWRNEKRDILATLTEIKNAQKSLFGY